jgi:nucleoside kinase
MKSFDLIASGYCSLDRIIRIQPMARVGKTSIVQNHDNATLRYGGCGLNVAAALCRLGKSVLPIIRVGDDYESTGFKSHLEREKIATDAVVKITGVATSCCYLVENPSSDHMTLFYPGAMSEPYFRPYEQAWFESSKLALMTVASRIDNEEFLKKSVSAKLPLFLGMKMDQDAFPKVFLKSILKECTGVFANTTEADYIKDTMGVSDVSAMFTLLPKLSFIAITNGKQGSRALYREGNMILSHDSPIVPARKFVDAVGSGDAYISGFLYGWLEKKPIQECMHYGSTLASFVIEGMGATTTAPTLDLLQERFIQTYDKE